MTKKEEAGERKAPSRGGVQWMLLADSIKMQFRDRVGLFWALAFPLLFVLVFGLFYGGSNTKIGNVTVVDSAKNEMSRQLKKALDETNSYKVETATYTVDEAKTAIRDDKTQFVIILPENLAPATMGIPGTTSDIIAVYSGGDVQVSSAAASFLNDFVNRANLSIIFQDLKKRNPSATTDTAFKVAAEKTDTKTVTFFDFVYAGILCLALMNYNLTGVAGQLTSYREQKILKRLQTTPLKIWKFMASQITAFLSINVLQIAVLLVVGVVFFGAHIYGNYGYVIALCILGSLIFLALGFLIASLTRTNNAATGMATSISIVMMFLSGVFFSIQNLPGWIYNILRWLPLSPMITAMRNIALDSQSLGSQWQYILIMVGWLVVTLVVTSFTFKFSSD